MLRMNDGSLSSARMKPRSAGASGRTRSRAVVSGGGPTRRSIPAWGGLRAAAVRVAHAEPGRRVAHEVHFDEHRRLVADDPAVVPGLDGDDLRRGELQRGAVAVAHADAAARDEADVRVHAEVGADGRLHVRRPAEARLVDDAFDAAAAGRGDVHLDAADDAALGPFDRREQRIAGSSHQWRSLGIGSLPSAPAVMEMNSGSLTIDANTASTRASIISLLRTESVVSYSKKCRLSSASALLRSPSWAWIAARL